MKCIKCVLMKLSARRVLKAALPVCLAVLLPFSSCPAEEKPRGHRGPITKDALLLELEKIQGKEKEYVEGYEIEGSDIIGIINGSDYDISISNSVIKGGLDFRELPEAEVDPGRLGLSERRVKELREKGLLPLRAVENRIRVINSEIRSGLDASRTAFYGALEFQVSSFGGDATFSEATFGRDAYFGGADFGGYAYFMRSTFGGDATFSGAKFGGDADFGGADFGGNATFSEATFGGKAGFSVATFGGDATFSGSKFDGYAYFMRSTFGGDATFFGAKFGGYAYFSEAKFGGDADIRRSTFGGDATFSGAKFGGDADFGWADFGGKAGFMRSTFGGYAYFREAGFYNALTIAYSSFDEYADFRAVRARRLDFGCGESPSVIKGRLDFRGAKITEAHLQDIIFESAVDFSDAKFGAFVIGMEDITDWPGLAKALKQGIYPEVLDAKAEESLRELPQEAEPDNLLKVEILRGLNEKLDQETKRTFLQNPGIEGSIEQVTELPATVFRCVSFESDVYFIRTEFLGAAALERVNFKADARFTGAFKKDSDIGGKHFTLSYINTDLERILINWDQLPDPSSWVDDTQERIKSFKDKETENHREGAGLLEPLSHALGGLEAAFRAQGKLGDANRAYYHKKRAELMEAREEARVKGNNLNRFAKEAKWIFWGCTTGYGTDICRILLVSVLLHLFFTMLYAAGGAPYREPPPEIQKEFAFRLRIFDIPRYYLPEAGLYTVKGDATKKLINAFRLSGVLLFKFGARSMTISGNIRGVDYRYIVWVEWVLGYFVLAALFVTLSNTVPIVHRLLTGVF
jgi:uncharacterized protein YjbI with pentapeptide repeats